MIYGDDDADGGHIITVDSNREWCVVSLQVEKGLSRMVECNDCSLRIRSSSTSRMAFRHLGKGI